MYNENTVWFLTYRISDLCGMTQTQEQKGSVQNQGHSEAATHKTGEACQIPQIPSLFHPE